jgi:hypothetical protein
MGAEDEDQSVWVPGSATAAICGGFTFVTFAYNLRAPNREFAHRHLVARLMR